MQAAATRQARAIDRLLCVLKRPDCPRRGASVTQEQPLGCCSPSLPSAAAFLALLQHHVRGTTSGHSSAVAAVRLRACAQQQQAGERPPPVGGPGFGSIPSACLLSAARVLCVLCCGPLTGWRLLIQGMRSSAPAACVDAANRRPATQPQLLAATFLVVMCLWVSLLTGRAADCAKRARAAELTAVAAACSPSLAGVAAAVDEAARSSVGCCRLLCVCVLHGVWGPAASAAGQLGCVGTWFWLRCKACVGWQRLCGCCESTANADACMRRAQRCCDA